MLHAIVQGFATVGGLFVSACIFVAGICAIAFSTGVFFEQFGPSVSKASTDKSVTTGLKTGAILGILWSLAALYELGNWGAFLSIFGLFASLLFLAWLTWIIADSRRPYNPDFD